MHTTRLSLLLLASLATACTAQSSEDIQSEGGEDEELTSVSALSRSLTFVGEVFVRGGASDSEIASAVKSQTQTAFGALRTSNIGVNSRELKDVDAKTFVKTPVKLVKGTTTSDMLRVRYTYTDNAVVPKSMARRSGLSLGLLGSNYGSFSSRILTECTDNDAEARDFASSIWYVFNPALSTCKKAMAAEQQKIDADRAKLADPKTQVAQSEVERLYLPTTVKLSGNKTNTGASYPEYDRLWSGGVVKGKFIVSLVNGMLDHGHSTEVSEDSGYVEWLSTLREVLKVRPGLKLAKIEPAEDLTTFTISGKTVKVAGITDAINWTLDGTGFPTGMSATDRTELKRQMGRKLSRHWVTLAAPLTVKIGTAAATPVSLEILTYFGAESDSSIHKRAIKNSDVFVYNGHSYIGYGPLDPSRFTASDFPASYQLLFIDSCVSYNYYEKDYIPLKSGGTKNLDLITNGLEAPAWESGLALGKFLAKLVDGSQASYLDLLKAASTTDSLRVADGELDNVYLPAKTPIIVK